MQASLKNEKNTKASIKNLKTRVRQSAKQLAEKQEGRFSTNTQINLKKHCNVLAYEGMVIEFQNSSNLILDNDEYQNKNKKKRK